jgi:ABC-type multidrug transport system fused ATPase/permease subunit
LEDEEMNERNNPVTQIIIAHRMTTIQHCDKILVVDQGQVIEQGNHETLLEKFPFGLYA